MTLWLDDHQQTHSWYIYILAMQSQISVSLSVSPSSHLLLVLHYRREMRLAPSLSLRVCLSFGWINSFLSSYIHSCCFFSVFLFLFPSNRIEGLIHNSKTPCFCLYFSQQQSLWYSVPYLHSTIDWPKFANFQFLESYETSLICMDGLMFHHHNS